MNALAQTAHDLAAALVGKRRVPQAVFISATVFSGSPLGPKYIVLVTPDRSERGEYYEVWQRGLDALKNGTSPEELELEPYEPEDEGDDFYPADDRACSAGDRAYQAAREVA